MNTNTISLVPRRTHGWWMGMANMLSKENFAWWRTRRWWLQILIALVIINGTTALNMRGMSGAVDQAAANTLMTIALFVPVIAVSLIQDAILGERHSGTAAWVLSKPLRRPAFIFSKVIAYGLGLLATWVVIPFIIFYFQLTHAGRGDLSIPGFIGMAGLAYLNLLFYMALALMLATLFNNRGPVLGISILIAWIGPLGMLAAPIDKYIPWLVNLMPWKLIAFVGVNPPLGVLLAIGEPLPTVVPIIATLLWCVLFVGVAIWRFREEEF